MYKIFNKTDQGTELIYPTINKIQFTYILLSLIKIDNFSVFSATINTLTLAILQNESYKKISLKILIE